MRVLDSLYQPTGREQITRRPCWRVQDDNGRKMWAYVESRANEALITGYPKYEVDLVIRPGEPIVGLIIGGFAGIFMGAAVGGCPGAAMGCLVLGLLGAGATGGSQKLE